MNPAGIDQPARRHQRGGRREGRVRLTTLTADEKARVFSEAGKLLAARYERDKLRHGRVAFVDRKQFFKQGLDGGSQEADLSERYSRLNEKRNARELSKSKNIRREKEYATGESSLHVPTRAVKAVVRDSLLRLKKLNARYGTHAATIRGAIQTHNRLAFRKNVRSMLHGKVFPASKVRKLASQEPGNFSRLDKVVGYLIRALFAMVLKLDYKIPPWVAQELRLSELEKDKTRLETIHRVVKISRDEWFSGLLQKYKQKIDAMYNVGADGLPVFGPKYRVRRPPTPDIFSKYLQFVRANLRNENLINQLRLRVKGDMASLKSLLMYMDAEKRFVSVSDQRRSKYESRYKREQNKVDDGLGLSNPQMTALRILLIIGGVEPNPGPNFTRVDYIYATLNEQGQPLQIWKKKEDAPPEAETIMCYWVGDEIVRVCRMPKGGVSTQDPLDILWEDSSWKANYDGAQGTEDIDGGAPTPALSPSPSPPPAEEEPPVAKPQPKAHKVVVKKSAVSIQTQKAQPVQSTAPAKKSTKNKEKVRVSRNVKYGKQAGLIGRALAEEHAKAMGALDAAREMKREAMDTIVIDADPGQALEEIKEKVYELDSQGFKKFRNGPSMTFCFHGRFDAGGGSSFNVSNGADGTTADPIITVNVYEGGYWSSDACGYIFRVKITESMLLVAQTSVCCTDPTKRMMNIQNGLAVSKDVKKDIQEMEYDDRVHVMQNMELIAFLLTGTITASGKLRWQNDVPEYLVYRYTCEPPTDWQERLKDVSFSDNTMSFEASQVRNTRAGVFVADGASPHMPDPTHMPTLITGMCKRLYPDLPQRSPRVLNELVQVSTKLANVINREYGFLVNLTVEQRVPDLDVLVEAALKGRNKGEREGITEGVKMAQDDPNAAIDWYKTVPYTCFIKLESYPDGSFKPPRFIMSLPLKARGIQLFFMIQVLYVIEKGTAVGNVKGLTADQITEKLKQKFENCGLVAETDFSSFESCIGIDLKRVVENHIFLLIAHNLGLSHTVRFIYECLGRETVNVHGPCFTIPRFHHIRMSGDLWTSIGNLVTNVVVLSYCTQIDPDYMLQDGLFEGDDGVFPAPADPAQVIARSVECGVKLTFDIAPWHALSFCGNHFEEWNGELFRHRDKFKALANLTVLYNAPKDTLRHDRMLQRSKCLSYLCGPIIPDTFVFAAVVERVTRKNVVDADILMRMGKLKQFSEYGLESCIPDYLIHDSHGCSLTDSQFCKVVFKMNRDAGGDCTYARVVEMMKVARAAKPTDFHVVLPCPFMVNDPVGFYARDGSRFTHVEYKLGLIPLPRVNVKYFFSQLKYKAQQKGAIFTRYVRLPGVVQYPRESAAHMISSSTNGANLDHVLHVIRKHGVKVLVLMIFSILTSLLLPMLIPPTAPKLNLESGLTPVEAFTNSTLQAVNSTLVDPPAQSPVLSYLSLANLGLLFGLLSSVLDFVAKLRQLRRESEDATARLLIRISIALSVAAALVSCYMWADRSTLLSLVGDHLYWVKNCFVKFCGLVYKVAHESGLDF